MNAEREWPSILQFKTGDTITEKLVEQRYRKLARTFHPDLGGSDADMQQINLAKQLAMKWIDAERKRQQQVSQFAGQVADLQRSQQQIKDIYAYQQQQMSQWANNLGGWGQGMAGAESGQRPAYVEYEPAHKPGFFERMGNIMNRVIGR